MRKTAFKFGSSQRRETGPSQVRRRQDTFQPRSQKRPWERGWTNSRSQRLRSIWPAPWLHSGQTTEHAHDLSTSGRYGLFLSLSRDVLLDQTLCGMNCASYFLNEILLGIFLLVDESLH